MCVNGEKNSFTVLYSIFEMSSGSPIVNAFAAAPVVAAQEAEAAAQDQDVVPIAAQDHDAVVPESRIEKRSRSLQQVSTIPDRVKVVKWMLEEVKSNDEEFICSKTVRQFPAMFRGKSNANLTKASRWWKQREKIMESYKSVKGTVTSRQNGGRSVSLKKSSGGRGPKRALWVCEIHELLKEEFERLSSAGLKFKVSVLQYLTERLIENHETYNNTYRDPKDNKLIINKITQRWIQTFMERYSIVVRSQTGKLQVSALKQRFIHMEVAYHLGVVSRGFQDGSLREEMVENMDETHFVINMDNAKTLGFVGDDNVKYADVASGGVAMTMVVRITGGPSASIQPPFMIFTNVDRNYPIRGVADNVPGVSYRTGPKGWMDRTVFGQYLQERRAIRRDPLGRKRSLFMDNCGGHNEFDGRQNLLNAINTDVHFLPENATDLCQPADSFVISKIKDAWTTRWDKEKVDLIEGDQWKNNIRVDGSWSGKLKNPGKSFFLKLAADSVRDVNRQTDVNGMNFARKAMIRCGLSLNVSGEWEEKQLFPHLQNIIKEHREYFEGKLVSVEAAQASLEEVKEVEEIEDPSSPVPKKPRLRPSRRIIDSSDED